MNFERLWHWERFAPSIGNNRELPDDEQLVIEVGVGLTYAELDRAKESISALFGAVQLPSLPEGATPRTEAESAAATLDVLAERVAVILAPFLRLGATHHTLNGKPISTLRDYVRFAVDQPGAFNALELIRTLTRLNSFSGTQELFSAPPSGGSSSTTRRPSAPAGSQTGGR